MLIALFCSFLHRYWLLDMHLMGRVLFNRSPPFGGSLIHLLPIGLNLIVANSRDSLEDHVSIDILDETVLAEFIWILRSHEDVLHDNFIDLVSFGHLGEFSLFILLWLNLVEAFTQMFFAFT